MQKVPARPVTLAKKNVGTMNSKKARITEPYLQLAIDRCPSLWLVRIFISDGKTM